VVLVWDGLSAHRSRGNPVELLWSAIKTRELANLAGDHLAYVADAAERRVLLAHSGPQQT
jgi:hypothetical protein